MSQAPVSAIPAPPTGAGRIIPLAGVSNFRDLGGYALPAGGRLRRGRIYRSAALAGLTEADEAAFLGLGLRGLCDLRSEHERAAAPDRLPEGAEVAVSHIAIASGVSARLQALLASAAPTPEAYRAILTEGYRAFVRDHAAEYRRFFAALLDAAAWPFLFHCSAGKDRTGLGAALLLVAAGADEDTAMEDYLLTNSAWRGESAFARSAPEAMRATILSAERAYLEAAFAAMAEDHGSVQGYLEAALGVGAAERRALREMWVED